MRPLIVSLLLLLCFSPTPTAQNIPNPELMKEYNRAWRLIGHEHPEEAIAILKGIIARDTTFHRAYKGLVEAYHQTNHLDEAERYFLSLLEQDPQNGFGHYGLGEVYHQKKAYRQAIAEYKQCISSLPDWQGCYTGLTASYPGQDDKGRATEARAHLQQVIDLNPDNPAPYLGLAFELMDRFPRQHKKAENTLRTGLKNARMVKDIELEGLLLKGLGFIYGYHNSPLISFVKALEHDQAALTIFGAIGDEEEIIALLDYLAGTHLGLGDYEESLAYYQQALKLRREVGHKRLEAYNLWSLAMFYRLRGSPQEAIGYYDQALKIFEQLGDTKSVTGMLTEIGRTYQEVGDYDQAMANFQQFLEKAHELNDKRAEAFALRRIGMAYHDLGDGSRALDYQMRSVELFQAHGYTSQAGAGLGNIGKIYQFLGDYPNALKNYRRSLKSAIDHGDLGEEERNRGYLGGLYLQMGQDKEAKRHLDKALRITRRLDKLSPFKATVLLNLGEVYRRQGQPHALAVTQQALEAATRENPNKYLEGRALNGLAQLFLQRNEVSKAEAHFHRALELGKATQIRQVLWEAHAGLGDLLERRGRDLEALEHYKQAIEVIESVRRQMQVTEHQSSFLENNTQVYERMTDLLFRLHEAEPAKGYDRQAFHYSERGRARAFLDMLAESKAQIKEGLPPEQRARQRAIERELSLIYRDLMRGPPEKRRGELLTALKKAEENQAAFKAEIRRTHPKYAQLEYPEPYDADRIQTEVLDDDTILIEYALGKKHSYVWVITKQALIMKALPGKSVIEKEVREYLQAITTYPKSERAFVPYYASAARLYNTLIGPISTHLKNGRPLIIVPDGILYYVPFEPLTSDRRSLGNPNAVDNAPRCLLDDHTVAYVPSASVLGHLMTAPASTTGTRAGKRALLAYADPVFSQSGPSPIQVRSKNSLGDVTRSVYEGAGFKLPPLPHTRTEVNSIAKLYPAHQSKIFLDEQATEASLKRQPLSDYRHIHLATHAIIDKNIPSRSGVVLSLVNTGEEDGVLRLGEILDLKLDADLVVLSACETGLGRIVRGEGMVGLTRAFMHAGTPRVVVSLWKVADEPTPVLMQAFYRQMTQGKSKGQALREAKQEMRRSQTFAHRHPYFWAAFILTGAR